MPVHRSYDVNCDKEGQKLGGAVSSRKSWIPPLITFFVLAGIIVTACLLTRRLIVEHPVNDKLVITIIIYFWVWIKCKGRETHTDHLISDRTNSRREENLPIPHFRMILKLFLLVVSQIDKFL